ncbi:MAG: AAA family ATPase [Promethearchaeia archaeon]|nr:MAG: AAA family ATPase [Candidatus Lokiarchaeia archaeon]
MPKKKLGHRISHLSSETDSKTEENESPQKNDSKTENLSLNIEITSDESLSSTESEKIIQTLIIAPAGYPIKPFDAPDTLNLTLNRDPKLFQAYATEQWLGLSVQVNDYIFDQLLIPDFAFKILKIEPPETSRIGTETNIILQQPAMPKPKLAKISFDEIIGNQNAKEKAEIIITYLQSPEKFGEWAPKNVLFYGPPGTGKTLMARAIASQADCSFFAKKGTTLIGLHVGDGAAKIHALFKKARDNAPSIIFIDELDSIGLNRSYQSVRGDVVEVATALLAELDGLEPNEGVITVAATNNMDLLDIGLRNRFEEEIEFPQPNEEERAAMLKLFGSKSPIPIQANYDKLAKLTEGWSGRELHEKLMKIAVHTAIRKKKSSIDTELFLKLIKKAKPENSQNDAPKEIFS